MSFISQIVDLISMPRIPGVPMEMVLSGTIVVGNQISVDVDLLWPYQSRQLLSKATELNEVVVSVQSREGRSYFMLNVYGKIDLGTVGIGRDTLRIDITETEFRYGNAIVERDITVPSVLRAAMMQGIQWNLIESVYVDENAAFVYIDGDDYRIPIHREAYDGLEELQEELDLPIRYVKITDGVIYARYWELGSAPTEIVLPKTERVLDIVSRLPIKTMVGGYVVPGPLVMGRMIERQPFTLPDMTVGPPQERQVEPVHQGHRYAPEILLGYLLSNYSGLMSVDYDGLLILNGNEEVDDLAFIDLCEGMTIDTFSVRFYKTHAVITWNSETLVVDRQCWRLAQLHGVVNDGLRIHRFQVGTETVECVAVDGVEF